MTGWATCRWVKPGSGRGGVVFGQVDQGLLELADQHRGWSSIASRSHRRMSVATWSLRLTAGVQALAGVAHQRGEALLDVEVHVLEVERSSRTRRDSISLGDLRHAALDVGQVVRADDALAGQHLRRGPASRGCPGAAMRLSKNTLAV